MKWQFVFCGHTVKNVKNFEEVRKFISDNTSYRFFTFNGLVYYINGTETGLTVRDLI